MASRPALLQQVPYRQEALLLGRPCQVPHPYQDSCFEVLRQLAYHRWEAYRQEAYRQEEAFEVAFPLEARLLGDRHFGSKPSR